MNGAPSAHRPIFIIGNPRSGTTLLRLMLTCHPRIVIPPEAGFAIGLLGAHGGFRGRPGELERFTADLAASAKFEHWKLSAPVLEGFLRDTVRPSDYAGLVSGVYACYASVHQDGKPRWGDKNNFYLAHVETLASLFPGAVFLHIVRDGRDVACSYRSLADVKGKYAPTLPSRVFDAMCEWNRNLARIRRAFARVGRDRVLELRYEDLVREPELTLRTVCDFLGEDYSPAMLAYDRENRDRELEPREFDAWKRRNREGIDPTAVGRWTRELSPGEAALAELTGRRMLVAYGYALAGGAGPRVRMEHAARLVVFQARRIRRRLARPAARSAPA